MDIIRIIWFVALLPFHLYTLVAAALSVRKKVRHLAVVKLQPIEIEEDAMDDFRSFSHMDTGLKFLGFDPVGDYVLRPMSEARSTARFFLSEERTTMAIVGQIEIADMVQPFFEFSTVLEDGFQIDSASIDEPIYIDETSQHMRQYPGCTLREVYNAHRSTVQQLKNKRGERPLEGDISVTLAEDAANKLAHRVEMGHMRPDKDENYLRFTLRGAINETYRAWIFALLHVNPLRHPIEADSDY